MNRTFSLIVRYLTFVAALAGFVGIGLVVMEIKARETGELPPPPVAPPGKPYAQTVAATGILEAQSENVAVGVPVSGLVMEMPVQVNQKVEKGDLLFLIDDRELAVRQEAAVEVARAGIGVQQANLAKAQDQLDRVKSVPDSRALSVDEIRSRESEVSIGKAQLLAAEAELASALAEVKQTQILKQRLRVTAPRDGVILQVNVRAGEYATNLPNSPVMVLGDLDTLQVRADVDEQNATRIRPGQAATAYIKGDTKNPIPLAFLRVEPYVIPKVSLTGSSTERVDTRVLQVIYKMERPEELPVYVGQQVDVYIDAASTR
jgi:RND family efflux transporter MFP subunit